MASSTLPSELLDSLVQQAGSGLSPEELSQLRQRLASAVSAAPPADKKREAPPADKRQQADADERELRRLQKEADQLRARYQQQQARPVPQRPVAAPPRAVDRPVAAYLLLYRGIAVLLFGVSVALTYLFLAAFAPKEAEAFPFWALAVGAGLLQAVITALELPVIRLVKNPVSYLKQLLAGQAPPLPATAWATFGVDLVCTSGGIFSLIGQLGSTDFWRLLLALLGTTPAEGNGPSLTFLAVVSVLLGAFLTTATEESWNWEG